MPEGIDLSPLYKSQNPGKSVTLSTGTNPLSGVELSRFNAMPAQLDETEQAALLRIIDHVVMTVNAGYLEYQRHRRLSEGRIASLQSAERNTAKLLSEPFVDYLAAETIHLIIAYRERAVDLLQGMQQLARARCGRAITIQEWEAELRASLEISKAA